MAFPVISQLATSSFSSAAFQQFQDVPGSRFEVSCCALQSGFKQNDSKFHFANLSGSKVSEFYNSQEGFYQTINSCILKKVSKNDCSLTPSCLIKRVGGNFWEEADSDNSASDRFSSLKGSSRKPKVRSVLMNLICDIEPLDINHISKDASPNSMDAMKRTISGMLGLLPSDQFQVMVETDRESLERLLVSSMMTGYTLRNAEYRMSLQRSLDLSDSESADFSIDSPQANSSLSFSESVNEDKIQSSNSNDISNSQPTIPISTTGDSNSPLSLLPENLGELSPEAAAYIYRLQSKVNSISQQLEECKRTLAAIELEDIVGDEPNDLLDYLRSLEPDKVTELSQPTTSDVRDAIQLVIDNLLGSLTPIRSPLSPPLGNNSTSANGMIASSSQWEGNSESDSSSNLQFQSMFTTTRDYLARLLFWCMMLGHYMRALEYRLELSRTFNLACASKLMKENSDESV